MFKANNNKIVDDDSSRIDETVVDLSKFKNKKSRQSTYVPNIIALGKPNFLTPNAKKSL